eukprot:scaffold302_cov397-Prasinococcus_capsulatus_cf.AAC.1
MRRQGKPSPSRDAREDLSAIPCLGAPGRVTTPPRSVHPQVVPRAPARASRIAAERGAGGRSPTGSVLAAVGDRPPRTRATAPPANRAGPRSPSPMRAPRASMRGLARRAARAGREEGGAARRSGRGTGPRDLAPGEWLVAWLGAARRRRGRRGRLAALAAAPASASIPIPIPAAAPITSRRQRRTVRPAASRAAPLALLLLLLLLLRRR